MGQGTVTTNRLIHEQSPYLLQHAHNPVDWYPWGSEALSRAKAEDRPILLSSGYSACHWCHVMERESFTNPRIAQMMNENFVCIKVDREERPDLDETYQTACLLLTGHGGWPLTVFLTPDLKPFYAGTYFPPEDKYGRPGFIRILQTVARVYRTERERVEAIAQDIVKGMKGQLLPENTEPGISLESWDWTDLPREAVSRLKYSYDTRHGGFGDAPKFPTTNLLQLFLHVGYEADPASVDMVVDTLLHMARGGIRDHLGGGFHRYSTDARWLVPHFEKMLYDNALLVPLYLAGYQLTGEPEFREVVESTLQFVASEMTAPGGGFYSSFDADTEGEEGRYYVWRYQEVIDLLGEEPGEILCDYFGISPEGNFAKGTSVLHRSTGEEQLADKYRLSLPGIQDILAQGRAQMLAHRTHREKPFCDTKIITAWNGMMISAFAQAARILDVPGYGKQAEAAAHFILENLMDGRGRLLRAFKDRPSQIPGFLSDYGWLINGLLDLHAATFDHSWLTQARSLTEVMVERFWDEANGGWFDSDEEHDSPLLRTKGITDQSYPSAASQAVLALIRLAEVDHRFPALIDRTFDVYADEMAHNPWGCAALLTALQWWQSTSTEVMLLGDSQRSEWQQMVECLRAQFIPRLVLFGLTPGWEEIWQSPPQVWVSRQGALSSEAPAVAFVCREGTCSPPLTSAQDLAFQLGKGYEIDSRGKLERRFDLGARREVDG